MKTWFARATRPKRPTRGARLASRPIAVEPLEGRLLLTATDIWTGLGTNANWSNPANWSLGSVPTSTTAVEFTNTSSRPSVVDPAFSGTVASLLLTSIYTGSLTLGRGLTDLGTFTQGGGTYNANGNPSSVAGLTSLYAGTYLASTASQYFTGGLSLLGGTLVGSTGNILAGSVAIGAGTLDAPSSTLYVNGGNFTYTAGTFNADGGTVESIGTNVSPTFSVGTGKIKFANFTDDLADAYPTGFTISGTLTTTGTFSWLVSASSITGNIEAQGNVNDENHGGIGNPYLTLDGPANQTIEDLSGSGGGQFRTITINKSAGTVGLACNPVDFSGLALVAGAVNTGAYSWDVAGPFSATAGLNLGNITVDGPGAAASGVTIQVANVTFAASADKLTAPTGGFYVSGNWIDGVGGAFVPNGGNVNFDGTGTQYLLACASFNGLAVLAGSSVTLEANATVLGNLYTFGTLNLNGHKLIR